MIGSQEDVHRHYCLLLRRGFPQKHARRLAHGCLIGLGLQTDTTFMAGRNDDGFGLDNVARRRAYAKARREGTDIGGKVWMPGLNAWVGSKAEVKALAAAKGCGVAGSVSAKGPEPLEPAPEGRYEVAESIVQREVEGIVDDNRGDVTPKERKQLVEDTRGRLRGAQDD